MPERRAYRASGSIQVAPGSRSPAAWVSIRVAPSIVACFRITPALLQLTVQPGEKPFQQPLANPPVAEPAQGGVVRDLVLQTRTDEPSGDRTVARTKLKLGIRQPLPGLKQHRLEQKQRPIARSLRAVRLLNSLHRRVVRTFGADRPVPRRFQGTLPCLQPVDGGRLSAPPLRPCSSEARTTYLPPRTAEPPKKNGASPRQDDAPVGTVPLGGTLSVPAGMRVIRT